MSRRYNGWRDYLNVHDYYSKSIDRSNVPFKKENARKSLYHWTLARLAFRTHRIPTRQQMEKVYEDVVVKGRFG